MSKKLIKRFAIRNFFPRFNFLDKRASNPLNRRERSGQLRGFMPEFNDKKMKLIAPLMQIIHKNGQFDETLLLQPELSELDERVVEYPVALDALVKVSKLPTKHILDVGCVLNNLIIKDYVVQLTDSISFLNPSRENLVYDENVAYIQGDIREIQLPADFSFDLVTCLSTLEHIGMDNTRYGGSSAEFQGYIDNPEKYAIEGLQKISQFVKPGGRLLVSVPYGPFEFLYKYGQPDRPIYYTFDEPRLTALHSSLKGFESEISVYKVIPGHGWVKTNKDDEKFLKHADQCASAGGVAFIEAVKRAAS